MANEPTEIAIAESEMDAGGLGAGATADSEANVGDSARDARRHARHGWDDVTTALPLSQYMGYTRPGRASLDPVFFLGPIFPAAGDATPRRGRYRFGKGLLPMPYELLRTIQGPHDVKRLPIEQLPQLADEIRRCICDQISRTGGHFASNLCTDALAPPDLNLTSPAPCPQCL